nr:hypothetical protein [Tanacetum cinerariifolium]
MQTTKEKVDTSKALDASSVDTESSRTESKEHDTSSRSGNDAHDDAEIRPIYDEEPMAEVQTTAKINVFAIGQQHTEQPEFNVNSRAKDPSNKITNINKPIEQISVPNTQERQIPPGHSSELGLHDHSNEQLSSKLVPNVVPLAGKTNTS